MSGKKINLQSKYGNTDNLADMIPNVGAGVGELIKNSYDADATTVVVEMNGAFEQKLSQCQMMISDDGHGMSEEELQHFFTVGDSKNKKSEFRVSKKGRVRTGGKGIGRFACKKIARKTTLITKAKNNPTYSLVIDWDAHDDSTNMEDVEFEYFDNEPAYSGFFPSPESSGTYLILEDFRETMKSKGGLVPLQQLHRKIQSLVNPFSEIGDFEIDLRVPDEHKKWENVETRELVKYSQYSFEANIDAQGKNVEWKFKNNHPWSKKEEHVSKTGSWKTSELLNGQKCSTKVTKIWINYLSRDAAFMKTYVGSTGRIPKDDIDRLCGFKLYRGNHRINPYGEVGVSENGDWLGLTSLRNTNNVPWFGHNQLIAAAEVDPTANPGIADMANRTGLADTPEKRQLIDLLRAITKKMKVDLCNPVPNKKPKWLKPPEFHYTMSIRTEVGSNLSQLPNCKFSVPSQWIIKPNLPLGLTLDNRTGEISGSAEIEHSESQFTVKGKNSIGEYSFTFWLSITKPQEPEKDDSTDIDTDLDTDTETDTGTDIYADDDILIDYKVAIRNNVHAVRTKLDRINNLTSINQILGELRAAKEEIENMINSLDENN